MNTRIDEIESELEDLCFDYNNSDGEEQDYLSNRIDDLIAERNGLEAQLYC